MPEIKSTFTQGKMNKDLDERIVPNGQYRDAMNIQVSTSDGSDIGAVQNILGNFEINANPGGGQIVGGGWECVGSIADEKNDVLYWFIAHDNRGGAILELEKNNPPTTPSNVTIVVNDLDGSLLNFSTGDIITGINIVDNLLFWTDGNSEPKKINIDRCKQGTDPSDLSVHSKLVVNGEIVPDEEITVIVSEDSITTAGQQPPASDIIKFSNASDLLPGDQFIQLDSWNFQTSGTVQNVTVVSISGNEVTLSETIFNTGTAQWGVGDVGVFHRDSKILREEHITVIKKRPTQAPKMKLIGVGDESGSTGIVENFSLSSHYVGETNVMIQIPLDSFLQMEQGQAWTPYFPDPWLDVAGNSYDETTFLAGGYGGGCDLYNAHPLNINVGDVLLLSSSIAQGVLPNNAQIRFLITSVDIVKDPVADGTAGSDPCSYSFSQIVEGTILHIDSEASLDTINYNFVIEDLQDLLFEKSFPRFATRYKYEDGEYSAFSPFTQVGFLPGEFSIHPTKEPYNSAMDTRIKNIELKEFVTYDIPDDVVEIDLLYKNDDANVVYIIETIKPPLSILDVQSKENWDIVDIDHSTNPPTKKYLIQLPSDAANTPTGIPSNTGYYRINSKNIHAAIKSNQLLRPWDNVPKKAKAQEFTANRLMYGNYIQNLNLEDYIPNVILRREERTFASEPTDFSTGIKSIKSQRTYQGGIILGDKYGRETPVFTSTNGSVTIPYDLDSSGNFDGAASKSNRLYFSHYMTNLPINTNISTSTIQGGLTNDPYYYKVFVKETASEYYNLVMDRVYRAEEDGNLWISFPSSDRNKLQEDDYIILKKSLGVGNSPAGQVEIENKFKVIDIKNEAPEFIKKKYIELGELDGNGTLTGVGGLYPNSILQPYADVKSLIINKDSLLSENLADIQNDYDEGQKFSITFKITQNNGDTINSRRYNIISLVTTDSSPDNFYTLVLDKPIASADGWVESSTGVLDTTLKTTLWKEEIQEWEEFQGRFFVKILSNIVTDQYLEAQIGINVTNALSAQTKLFYVGDDVDSDDSGGKYDQSQDGLYAGVGYKETNPYNTGGSGISNEVDDWEDQISHFDQGQTSGGWFIDSAYYASIQPTIISDTSSTYYWGNTDVPAGTANATLYDVSTSWNLRKSYGVNGMQGCIETSTPYTNPLAGGAYMWKSQRGAWGNTDPNGNPTLATAEPEVYGTTDGKFYMHLSYTGVGEPLHTGAPTKNGFNVTFSGTDYQSAPSDWDLQAIDNFNQQRNFYRTCPWPQTSSLNAPNTKNQWNPGYNNPGNEEIIKNLVVGNKFQFSHDVNGNIFTILKVVEKRLYNHTSWNRVMHWNPTGGTGGTGGYEEDDSAPSVNRAYEYWDNNKSNASLAQGAFENILTTIKDFAQPHNRRVCYILELDKNPDTGTLGPNQDNYVEDASANTGIQEVIKALSNNGDLSAAPTQTPTFMRFLKSYVSENSTILSDDPAVWETEPTKDTDLDIYYEASDAIPLVLDANSASAGSSNVPMPDNAKGHMIAPIGTSVRCSVTSSHLSTPNFGDCVVSGWDGNIVTLDPGLDVISGVEVPDAFGNNPGESGYTTTTSSGSNLEHQIYLFGGGNLKFYKDDLSYISINIYEPKELSGAPHHKITKFILTRSINKKIGLPYFNCYSFGNGVESNRIRDDFNKPYISNGVKASSTLHEQYKEDIRGSGLIYSGLYNKTTSFNELNQFIMAEKITKELSPSYGSIQKLFTRDEDLIAFCEDKVVQIFADKDILYNADGNPQLLSSNRVLGQSRPFEGDYGISKNPESFARESYRAYFVDKQRGSVLRLSKDGLTPISEAGMNKWFKDELKKPQYNIIGSYDHYKKDYNLTLDGGSGTSSDSYTLTYSENVKGWVSFKSFIQESGVSMSGDYYTFKGGRCYRHHNDESATNRNTFYSGDVLTAPDTSPFKDSSITFIMNEDPLSVKNFNTLNYDGDGIYTLNSVVSPTIQNPPNDTFTGWLCESISTEGEPGDPNYQSGTIDKFIEKEGKFFNYIKGNAAATDTSTKHFSFQGIGTASNIT